MGLLKFSKIKMAALLSKVKSADKLLKLIFIIGIIGFAFSTYLFKFELLGSLNVREYQRLEVVQSLQNLIANPSELFNGLLQHIGVKMLPAHQIFALRMPTGLMVLASVFFVSSVLYIRFRNRYLPYTYLVLAITSPWLILLAHQGYLPGIDIAFFSSLLLLSFMAVTSTSLRTRRKELFFLLGTGSLAALSLQPFGIPITITLFILLARSTELKYQIIGFGKPTKVASFIIALIPLAINAFVVYKNHYFIQITTGFSILKEPKELLSNISIITRSIFGLDQSKGLNSGTNRPDFLLIGALVLTIYEA